MFETYTNNLVLHIQEQFLLRIFDTEKKWPPSLLKRPILPQSTQVYMLVMAYILNMRKLWSVFSFQQLVSSVIRLLKIMRSVLAGTDTAFQRS